MATGLGQCTTAGAWDLNIFAQLGLRTGGVAGLLSKKKWKGRGPQEEVGFFFNFNMLEIDLPGWSPQKKGIPPGIVWLHYGSTKTDLGLLLGSCSSSSDGALHSPFSLASNALRGPCNPSIHTNNLYLIWLGEGGCNEENSPLESKLK